MARLFCTFALAALIVSSAYAQNPPQPLDDVARGEALIQDSGLQDLFVAEPGEAGLIAVRHAASGMLCRLDPGNAISLSMFAPTISGAARGEDVSCNDSSPLRVRTFYATRYPTPQTVDAQMALAVGQILGRFGDLEEAAPAPDPGGYPPEVEALIPESRTAQFIIRDGPRPRMTRVSIAVVDGWVIKMRWTGELGSDTLADAAWRSALIDIVRFRRAGI